MQPRERRGSTPPSANFVVPQHLVLAERRVETCAQTGQELTTRRSNPCPPYRPAIQGVADKLLSVLRRHGFPTLHRERNQHAAYLWHSQSIPLRERRHQQLPRTWTPRSGEPGEAWDKSIAPLPADC